MLYNLTVHHSFLTCSVQLWISGQVLFSWKHNQPGWWYLHQLVNPPASSYILKQNPGEQVKLCNIMCYFLCVTFYSTTSSQVQCANKAKESLFYIVVSCYTTWLPIIAFWALLFICESVAKFCSPENTTTRLIIYPPESQFTRSLLTLLWWTLVLLWKYSTKLFLNGFYLHIQVYCRWKPVGAP